MMSKVFDLEKFKAFCRSKPRRAQYPVGKPDACALAQFGFPGVVTDSDLESAGIPGDVYSAVVVLPPYTFSALADRLDRLGGAHD